MTRSLRLLPLFALLGSSLATTAPAAPEPAEQTKVHYRSEKIEGLSIFFREAGPRDGPVVLLLHGFPSSSRMWDSLIPALADRYHVIAPDYPGFGHSDAPDPASFHYTFDHLARVVDALTEHLGVGRYFLVMQDYGGPVGFRLALAHPERVRGMVMENAAAHEAALGPLWEVRRAYWRDPAPHLAALKKNLLSLDAAKQRHVGTSPHPELYDPDTWTDEAAFLARPGEADIQAALFYDYRTNVASYPRWQAWLRSNRPPLLVTWGRYDPSFQVEGASAYKADLPSAEVHLLDAGHFPLDEKPEQVIALTRAFLDRQASR
jgi:pimeloyl-ACP methyl ester carboxylesterase